MNSHFGPQNLIINLTFCGDWAGVQYGNSTCSGDCVCKYLLTEAVSAVYSSLIHDSSRQLTSTRTPRHSRTHTSMLPGLRSTSSHFAERSLSCRPPSASSTRQSSRHPSVTVVSRITIVSIPSQTMVSGVYVVSSGHTRTYVVYLQAPKRHRFSNSSLYPAVRRIYI